VVSASPIVNRLSWDLNHNLLSNIRSSRTLISFQNLPSRPTSPAGGKAQCTRGPSSGNKGLRVLLSCRRPVSDPLWLIGPRAACLSRAPGHPKRPMVVKVLNPAKGRGLNFKNFENGGGPTIFKVFRVCVPATMPGDNSENSENGSGPNIFRVFRVQSPANGPWRNFENSENGGATTVFRVFRVSIPADIQGSKLCDSGFEFRSNFSRKLGRFFA